MKGKQIAGGACRVFGWLLLLIGAAAWTLPLVNDSELQAALARFHGAHESALVTHVNRSVVFALENAPLLTCAGLALLIVGLLLGASFARARRAEASADGAQANASPRANRKARRASQSEAVSKTDASARTTADVAPQTVEARAQAANNRAPQSAQAVETRAQAQAADASALPSAPIADIPTRAQAANDHAPQSAQTIETRAQAQAADASALPSAPIADIPTQAQAANDRAPCAAFDSVQACPQATFTAQEPASPSAFDRAMSDAALDLPSSPCAPAEEAFAPNAPSCPSVDDSLPAWVLEVEREPVDTRCAQCGAFCGEGARFCSECGAPVQQPTEAPAPHTPEARPMARRSEEGLWPQLPTQSPSAPTSMPDEDKAAEPSPRLTTPSRKPPSTPSAERPVSATIPADAAFLATTANAPVAPREDEAARAASPATVRSAPLLVRRAPADRLDRQAPAAASVEQAAEPVNYADGYNVRFANPTAAPAAYAPYAAPMPQNAFAYAPQAMPNDARYTPQAAPAYAPQSMPSNMRCPAQAAPAYAPHAALAFSSPAYTTPDTDAADLDELLYAPNEEDPSPLGGEILSRAANGVVRRRLSPLVTTTITPRS